MTHERLSPAIEDYLKSIYDLTVDDGRASTTQIADRMGIQPGSVTGMLRKLADSDPPLVEYEKHRGVQLTEAGRKAALEIVRHHRLLELFLQKVLGYSWDEVHGEADRLEHVISADMEERIAQRLGNPSYDPHGAPIPSRDFQLPAQASTPLAELQVGQRAVVQRVDDDDPDFLRYLSDIGMNLGARVTVLEVFPFDQNMHLEISDCNGPIVLGPAVTGRIFVENL